jgi:anti-sigma B factor antagonist
VVDCTGRLVAGEDSEVLNREVKRIIDNHINVVVNLGAITFIDSSGLGMLVRLASTTKHTPAGVKFCGVSEQMRRVVELTKLTGVLNLHDSESSAIAAFERKEPPRGILPYEDATILCLDTSVDLLACLRESLEHAGFHTQSAKTIPDAILLVRTIRPALVIAGPQFATKVVPMTSELKIPTIVLKEEFSTSEAGDAIESLLEEVRAKLKRGSA